MNGKLLNQYSALNLLFPRLHFIVGMKNITEFLIQYHELRCDIFH